MCQIVWYGRVFCVLFCFLGFTVAHLSYETSAARGDRCFCKLEGQIDDCSCSVDTVDYYSNMKLYPRLKSLVVKDYFRFYKVALKRKCPFWPDDNRCASKFCQVQVCTEEQVPSGLKGGPEGYSHINQVHKYSGKAENVQDCDNNEELGYLNQTISKETYEDLKKWKVYDEKQDNFCDLDLYDEYSSDMEYTDLLLNPERYTGYKGPTAWRIWHSIYKENCFKPKGGYGSYIDSTSLGDLCLEERVFYRCISGLHTSINIHLCANYLLSGEGKFGLLSDTEQKWGRNLREFELRFDPEKANNEGPQRLKNLYFLYLLMMRAFEKSAPYLENEEYFTGNLEEDKEVKIAVKEILNIIRSFPNHFNESIMFIGGQQALKLKEEFRKHFQNISRIMDCVSCNKCRLWGKLQIQGLGTALKILFSGNFDNSNPTKFDLPKMKRQKFQLQRNEIVALFNAFARLSASIYQLEKFREMLRST